MKHNNFSKKMPVGWMILLFILLTADALTGCTRRSEIPDSVITVENIPLYEENIEEVKVGEVTAPKEEPIPEEKVICVHICGAVVSPGVYEIPPGSRVYEAVMAAGGYRDDADKDYVNQALVLNDSDKLVIPTLADTEAMVIPSNGKEKEFGIGSGVPVSESSGKVNINTAGVEELCTLPGIGEARAKVIISYRESSGPFKSIEDIMNVSGIKQASFDKIKNDICVN
ncbi:MAG: helix-hairpin-helix domain-containing protein [Lachnospiraceae bacterium]|nr:helix-hairpin-helix domain-containing protein [Lachnospiraceae bacterium]